MDGVVDVGDNEDSGFDVVGDVDEKVDVTADED